MIKNTTLLLLAALALSSPLAAETGDTATQTASAVSRHEALLASTDPVLAANKRLVYDFWREVLEGGHLELAEKYLVESYIQHNPNVPTGRAGFVAFFSRFARPQPIEASVKAPLISITAEGDRVVVALVHQAPDPSDPSRTYTTTWFDMFRIADGKIVEHWDSSPKY